MVLDWDDIGPAEPGQELARALFDWCCDDARTEIDVMLRIMPATDQLAKVLAVARDFFR